MPKAKTKTKPNQVKPEAINQRHELSSRISKRVKIPFKFLWRKKGLSLLLLIGVSIAVFIGYRFFQSKKPPELETISAQYQTISKIIEASGQIEASESADLKFQTTGQLAWLGVKEGDWVKKWQAIASLDKRKLKKQLTKYLNTYLDQRYDTDFTRRSHSVFSNEFDRFFMSEAVKETLLRDQLTLENTVLDVEIQDITNKLATLTSPIDGIVTSMFTQVPGINILTTNAIATIVNPATTYFEVEVDEADIGYIKIGQKAQVFLDSYPDETIESEIAQIDFTATISEGSTVFLVKLSLPIYADEIKYRLGMTGDANIIIAERQETLAVPIEAVFARDGQNYIEVRNQAGQIEKRLIETGLETDDYLEILEGLEETEQVIIPQ